MSKILTMSTLFDFLLTAPARTRCPLDDSQVVLGLPRIKVAVYKYHTNEFVYKSEGVGAIADWEGKLMMS
jgi:hypothetical protein